MKKLLVVISVILLLALTLIVIPKPKYEQTNPFLSQNGIPLVMAHAGGKGVYPDNTMAAFEYSYNLGVDVLEMDVQITDDGILVLLHGQNVTGNTIQNSNCDAVVWEETYQYLNDSCNFGYQYQESDESYLYRDMTSNEWHDAKVHLTTLEEVFDEFGDSILYNIEIKADADAPRTDIADALADLIVEFDLESKVLVACAFDDISEYLIDTYPNLYVSTSYGTARKIIIGAYTLTSVFSGKPKYAAVQVPIAYELPVIQTLRLDTKLLINTLHQQNMAMHYWTVNDEETMRLLINQGADGIITDYPELLLQIISESQDS